MTDAPKAAALPRHVCANPAKLVLETRADHRVEYDAGASDKPCGVQIRLSPWSSTNHTPRPLLSCARASLLPPPLTCDTHTCTDTPKHRAQTQKCRTAAPLLHPQHHVMHQANLERSTAGTTRGRSARCSSSTSPRRTRRSGARRPSSGTARSTSRRSRARTCSAGRSSSWASTSRGWKTRWQRGASTTCSSRADVSTPACLYHPPFPGPVGAVADYAIADGCRVVAFAGFRPAPGILGWPSASERTLTTRRLDQDPSGTGRGYSPSTSRGGTRSRSWTRSRCATASSRARRRRARSGSLRAWAAGSGGRRRQHDGSSVLGRRSGSPRLRRR